MRTMIRTLPMTLAIFQCNPLRLFHIKFLVNVRALYGKSYYRVLMGNHTLAFGWCHCWWTWM